MLNRVILIILDGVGVGALPDAGEYGDSGSATLQHVAEGADGLNLPHLQQLGLGNLVELKGVDPASAPAGSWGRMGQHAAGKDSVVGHWELAGVVQQEPFLTYPQGFPRELIDRFTDETGLSVLGNVAASGTEILVRLGEEHLQSGAPIVYTSIDSVFQIAAHEDIIPPERLYELCRIAERLVAPYRVCRVIARPFVGEHAGNFRRTSRRHDFPCPPPEPTLLDRLQQGGVPTCGVGKIFDLFAGRGLDHSMPTTGNSDGMDKTLSALNMVSHGLIFTNLIDYDMLYGHRCDVAGFARALEEFDSWLPHLKGAMNSNDLLIVTADHGCDPVTPGTDHSREYVPLLCWSPGGGFIPGTCLGVRESFSDVAATVAELFAIDMECGKSFLSDLYRVNV